MFALSVERAQGQQRPRPTEVDAATQTPGRRFSDCGACPEMVVLPTGSYMMGSPESDADRWGDEGPVHRVRIGHSLAVGVHEVTFSEWDACVAAGGCSHRPGNEGWGRGSRPVINVSWEDAREYVRWLSAQTGAAYRLLSESEWEYAARGGTTTVRHWGESASGQCRYANGYDRTGHAELEVEDFTPAACADRYVFTAPVGVYEAKAFGLHEMLGNVWEWTEDCWNDDYSAAPTDGSAWRSGDCSRRVARGGSWGTSPEELRSAVRIDVSAGIRRDLIGFRVARTIN